VLKRGGNVLTNRQKLILKAIVEEYIKSNEPVGSKVLTQKPYLDFSSATIRYDMQYLEETGYLEKTHTSSGRIPSEKGYKFYVENLITRDEATAQVFPIIDAVILTDKDKDEKIKEIVDIISQYTGYMAAVLGSSANYQTVKKMEVVPLNERECVLLIVTSGGKVQSQSIIIPQGFKMDDLLRLINMFDNAMFLLSSNKLSNISE
jgi:heat-inducible transcriptional repressor